MIDMYIYKYYVFILNKLNKGKRERVPKNKLQNNVKFTQIISFNKKEKFNYL